MFSQFDYYVLVFLNSFSFLDPFMLFVSLQFDYFLFLILAVLFYYRGRQETILFLALLVSSWALAMSLKPVFEVPRPEAIRFVTCTTGYSMPSGHSLMSFALATFLHPKAGKYITQQIGYTEATWVPPQDLQKSEIDKAIDSRSRRRTGF